MTQNTAPEHDPLLGAEKRPAVSFKTDPIGTVKTLTVQSWSREAQGTVFGSNPPRLAFWENPDGSKGNPKMNVVYDVEDEQGEALSLWAPIPSSLRTALAEAQTAAGARIGPGGILEIKFVREVDKGKGNPQKIYAARYTPGTPPAPTGDALGTQPAAESDPWGTTVSDTRPTGDEPPF